MNPSKPTDSARTMNRLSVLSPWDAVFQRLLLLLGTPEKEPSFDSKLTAVSTAIINLIEKNVDMAIFMIMQLDQSHYAIAHALQSAVLCDIYACSVDWPLDQRQPLVCAALTMNIAMLELQNALCQQETPPTPEQRELITTHPMRGCARLQTLGVHDDDWLRIVAEHHERGNGKGYPAGITDVHPSAEVLNVADRYCAKIGRRRWRGSLALDRASREMLLLSAGDELAIVSAIIEAIGYYPPGSFVQLASGEIAIVTGRGEEAEKPQVCAIASATGVALPQPVPRDTHKPAFSVSQR